MSAESQLPPWAAQQWPCGPDCQHAQTLTGSYGEWHWCTHPLIGGRIARDGHECRHFAHAVSDRPPPLPWRR